VPLLVHQAAIRIKATHLLSNRISKEETVQTTPDESEILRWFEDAGMAL
jgi:hypothetical protein